LRRRLRELVRALRAWARAPKGARDAQRQGAEALAHRLRGTSGSYGLRSFSAAVGVVEEALRRERLEDAARAEVVTEIAGSLRRARSIANEAVRKRPSGTETAGAERL
jgi:hypothetical protein